MKRVEIYELGWEDLEVSGEKYIVFQVFVKMSLFFVFGLKVFCLDFFSEGKVLNCISI